MIEIKLDNETAAAGAVGVPPVCVIGIGGAGANVIDRLAMEGITGADLTAMNSDARALQAGMVRSKVQLGRSLTLGLGCGGDPELGHEAAAASIAEIRDALKDRRMVFICTGLGGGTGSGAAPLVARMARESGAMVVVFATMPFAFEGRRRMSQAMAALEDLRRQANALVTFENDRMGDMVLPEKGVGEAFATADRIIGQSIRAVTSLVKQPGLIRIGMDDLMTALRNADSRCLFGYGQAKGEERATQALTLAMQSPLLDRGQMLEKARNVLVHVCGGRSLTLFEIEGLMRELGRQVSSDAQILFGAAVDPSMEDAVSVTIISSVSRGGNSLVETVVAKSEPPPALGVVAPPPLPVNVQPLPDAPVVPVRDVAAMIPVAAAPLVEAAPVVPAPVTAVEVPVVEPEPVAVAAVMPEAPVRPVTIEPANELVAMPASTTVTLSAPPNRSQGARAAVRQVSAEVTPVTPVVQAPRSEAPAMVENPSLAAAVEEAPVVAEVARGGERPSGKFDLKEILRRGQATEKAEADGSAKPELVTVAPVKAEAARVQPEEPEADESLAVPAAVKPAVPNEADGDLVISLRVPEPSRVTPIRPIPAGQRSAGGRRSAEGRPQLFPSETKAASPAQREKAVRADSGVARQPMAVADEGQQTFDEHLTPAIGARGRFEKVEPTVEEGEDLDIPTFLRKKR
jgi:cell division protein FtsZ